MGQARRRAEAEARGETVPRNTLPQLGAKEGKDSYQGPRERTPEEIEALGKDAGAFLKNPPIEEGVRITEIVRKVAPNAEVAQGLFNLFLEATARGYALGRESCRDEAKPKIIVPGA